MERESCSYHLEVLAPPLPPYPQSQRNNRFFASSTFSLLQATSQHSLKVKLLRRLWGWEGRGCIWRQWIVFGQMGYIWSKWLHIKMHCKAYINWKLLSREQRSTSRRKFCCQTQCLKQMTVLKGKSRTGGTKC